MRKPYIMQKIETEKLGIPILRKRYLPRHAKRESGIFIRIEEYRPRHELKMRCEETV